MVQAISVRLDDEAVRALRALEAVGMSRPEAIRSALVASARRLRRSSELAAEVAALEADEDDREEMLAVADLMKSLRARGDVYRFKLSKGASHEQHGERFGVVVQAHEFLPRSVVLIAPTSQSALAASFPPEIDVNSETTRVLVEQGGWVLLMHGAWGASTAISAPRSSGAWTRP